MIRETSDVALQAVAKVVTKRGNVFTVHPVVAKRALAELYDKANARADEELGSLVSWATSFWRTPPTPEERYVRELAIALNCNEQEARSHLNALWSWQEWPSALERFQRLAMGQANTLDTRAVDADVYYGTLATLSRAESRKLLREMLLVCRQLGCDASEAITGEATPDRWNWAAFKIRLTIQAGHHWELTHDAPHRFTGTYLENLGQDQATGLLQKERTDGTPWKQAERDAVDRVLRRDPHKEGHYDRMRPADAWRELCTLTGCEESFEASISNSRVLSDMVYEVSTLPPSEHVAGLCRAAHLAVLAPAAAGIAQRLGIGENSSYPEVSEKLQTLTTFERVDLAEAMRDLRLRTCIDDALRMENIDVEPDLNNRFNVAPALDPSERIRPLTELSAHALGRAGAWQYLTKLCKLDHLSATMTQAARNELAAALVTQNPGGMNDYMELLAFKALILPRVRAEYAARAQQEHIPAEKHTLEQQI